jgi:polyphosphate kinase 2
MEMTMAKRDAERKVEAKGKAKKDKGGAAKADPDKRSTSTPANAVSNKEYSRELKKLHVELVNLQQWVVEKGLKVCIVFEGRDGAGKGGTIKAITERVSPRVFRVIALPSPTGREKSQMYGQRYIPHLPAAGEVVIWDRSWYNRAGVERVMGFCTEEEAQGFLHVIPLFEKVMVDSGIILLKYWLEVSPKEQRRRLEARIDDGRKIWKLSPMDLKSYMRWDDFTKARDDMFAATDTAWAPWYVAQSDDKKRARLNIITHLLSRIPFEARPHEKVKLPERKLRATQPPADTVRVVPEKF